MKIQIRDYQIIKEADLDVEGITFVIGPTNHGKSAIVRSVEGCLFNQPGSEFIRHGASKARVGVHFDKEQDRPPLFVAWEKTRKGAKFSINGELYSKTGRKTPTEEMEAEGIKELQIGDEKIRLTIWRQLDPAFLILKSPQLIFDTISAIMEEHRMGGVLKRMTVDRSDKQKEGVHKEGQISAYRQQISALEEKVEVLNRLPAANPRMVYLQRCTDNLETLIDLWRKLTFNKHQTKTVQESLKARKERLDALTTVRDTLEGLHGQWHALKQIKESLNSYQRKRQKAEHGLKVLEGVSNLHGRMEKINLTVPSSLRDELSRWKSLRKRIEDTRTNERVASGKAEKALSDFEVIKQEMGVCPLCEKPINGRSS